MNLDKTSIIPFRAKYLYKTRDGFFQPCLLKAQTKSEATIILTRCGQQKQVSVNSIVPNDKKLMDKSNRHTNKDKYVSVLGRLFL